MKTSHITNISSSVVPDKHVFKAVPPSVYAAMPESTVGYRPRPS
jgi:hypothetical protein